MVLRDEVQRTSGCSAATSCCMCAASATSAKRSPTRLCDVWLSGGALAYRRESQGDGWRAVRIGELDRWATIVAARQGILFALVDGRERGNRLVRLELP